MASISTEGTPVEITSRLEIGNLPISVSGHLLLVYKDDSGAEFVIRGGPNPTADGSYGNIILEVNEPIATSIDRRISQIDLKTPLTPEERGNTEIDFGARDPSNVWSILEQQAINIRDAKFAYSPFGDNSNTVVSNLLSLVGIDVDDFLPDPSGFMLVPFYGREREFSFDYSISGTSEGDILVGRGGQQTFYGNSGNDIMSGGDGNDHLYGGPDDDELSGEAGDDFLDGGTGNNTLTGGPGFDTASFAALPYAAYVNIRNADQSGFEVYRHNGTAIELTDLVLSTERFIGSSYADVAEYGRSNSGITVSPLTGDTAGLRVQKTGGEVSSRNIEFVAFEGVDGSVYKDVMQGNTADNVFYGRVGNDTFLPSAGSDIFYGGGNTDTADYSAPSFDYHITTLDAVAGNYRIQKIFQNGTQGYDLLFSVENLIGKPVSVFEAAGGQVIRGTALDDALSPYSQSGSIAGPFTFQGLGGTDHLSGSNANDRFEGGVGDDTMTGLRGNDVFFYAKGDGNDRISANGSGNDALYQTDQLVFGAGITRADLSFSRGASSDVVIVLSDGSQITLVGQLTAPVDFITFANGQKLDMETVSVPVMGTSGNDVLNGVPERYGQREGALVSEVMYGYAGNDTINAGGGLNTVYGGPGLDSIYGGMDADKLYGDADADRIEGGDGDDILSGGDGDDWKISGDNGNDVLSGGAGKDSLLGGAGDDQLSGDGGNDTLAGGTGNDLLSGGGGADTMNGDGGDDTLNGGSGNDTMNGGIGNDVLNGGAGRDRFVLTNNPGSDTILGFQKGLDVIALQLSSSLNAFSKLDIHQEGADAVIDLNASVLTLANYVATSLTSADFEFA